MTTVYGALLDGEGHTQQSESLIVLIVVLVGRTIPSYGLKNGCFE